MGCEIYDMSTLGQTIELYLIDGDAYGIWQCNVPNWSGISYKIPRNKLKEGAELPYIHTPGIYFLFGSDDETDKPFIYVGEAEDVLKRIGQPHTFENGIYYWTQAIVFLATDDFFDKARIKYLEHRFYTIAVASKRYMVVNGNTPTKSRIPMKIQDALERYILYVQLVMPALGHRVFEPAVSTAELEKTDDEDILYFTRSGGKGGKARGKLTDEKFWVLKGSYIYPELANYVGTGIRRAREEHQSQIDMNHILQEDVAFGSPSYAAAFVCGKNSNGLIEWKNKEGISLKNLNDQQEASPVMETKSETFTSSKGNIELYLTGHHIAATGKYTSQGFIVYKGSGFSMQERPSCNESLKERRAKLIRDGKVKN